MSIHVQLRTHRRDGEFGPKTFQKWFEARLQAALIGIDEDQYHALLEELGISEEVWGMRTTLKLPIKTIAERLGMSRRMTYYHLERARTFRELFWQEKLTRRPSAGEA